MNDNQDDQNPYSSTGLDQPTVPGPKTTTTDRGRFWATLLIVLTGFRAFALILQTQFTRTPAGTNPLANSRGHEVAMAQLIGSTIALILTCIAWFLLAQNSKHKSWGRLALGFGGFIFVLSLLII